MSRGKKLISWLLIVVIPIAGCQAVNVSYRDADSSTLAIALAAVAELNRKHPKYVAGIRFELYNSNGDLLAELLSNQEAPHLFEGLEPDVYEIVISGNGFEQHIEYISLTEEHSATLQFAVNAARGKQAIDNVILVTVGLALVTGLILLELTDDDDEDENEITDGC